jgi:HlyD family secretion protein
VLRSDLIQRVTVAGNITPNRKTLISAPYPGYIRKIFVNIGDAVKGGDPIVTLAQSLKENSEETYPLRAPFSGTVVQVLKTEGEYVDQQSGQGGNTLVRIDDLNHLFVDASVPEIEMGKLKVGQEVIIKASAVLGRSYKGRIKNISLAAKEQKDWDRSRVEFPVVIQILDNDHGLKPGMSVVLDIVTQKKTQILTLRHEFIQKNDNQYFVVTQQGERKEIDVGIQNEEVFEIKKGLTEGEKVRQTDFLSL